MTRKDRPSTSKIGFSDDDRTLFKEQFNEINSTIKDLVEEIRFLKKEVKITKNNVKELKIENERLKQIVNVNTYQVDNLEQYTRRDNLRLHGVKESQEEKDDGEINIGEMAKKLGIVLSEYDIQRAHRQGKRKPLHKPRQSIVRFTSYKKRMEFI